MNTDDPTPTPPPRRERETLSTPVNVRLSAAQYDRACAVARDERVSVPTVVRRALDQALRDGR